MSFWLRYILILIIGTMTVYWGAPALLAHLKPSVPGPHATSAPGTPDYGTTATPAPASATADAPITPAAPRPSIRRPPDADGTTVPAAPPAAAPAATPVPTAAVTAPPAKVVLDYTPSTTRIPSSGDDVTHWGMAIHLAPFFTKTGKRMDRLLPGGTLIEQITTTVSPDGEFSVCRLWDGKAWSEPFLVSTADLIRFPGGRDEVDADELEILARYHALHADMAARRVELTRAAVDANPHAAPLRELKQRYEDQRFLADKAMNLGDWEVAQNELKILCELVPDRDDPRHAEANARLVDVENRMKKARGGK